MSKEERYALILDILRTRGDVTVNYLAKKLFVSPSTIRRDYQELEARGLLHHTYGKATLNYGEETGLPLHLRRKNMPEAKLNIGKRAAELIHEGDIIRELDGEKIYINSDVTFFLSFSEDGVHDITVERDGQLIELRDFEMGHTHTNEDGSTYRHYGFSIGAEKQANLGDKLDYVWRNTADNVRMVRYSLQMLFTGRAGLQDMSGPVGIVSQMSQIAEQSETAKKAFLNLLSICAFIAINLAVMNLLPIPALDGGRIVALLITVGVEKLLGRKIDPKYEGYLHGAGMILLLGLMAVIMFKDIFVIMKG